MPRARGEKARKESLTAEEEAAEQQKLQKSREAATKRRQKQQCDAVELLRNARDLETVHNAILKDTVQRTVNEHIGLCTMALSNENIPPQLKEHVREIHQRSMDLKSGGFFGVDVPNHSFPWSQEPNGISRIGKHRVDIAIDFRPIGSETPQVVVRPSQEPPSAKSFSAHSVPMPTQPVSAPRSQLHLPAYESVWDPLVVGVEESSQDSQPPTKPTRPQVEQQTQAPPPWIFALPIMPGIYEFQPPVSAVQGTILGNIIPSSSDTTPPHDDKIPRLDDGHEMCSDGLVVLGQIDQVPVFGKPDIIPQYSTYDGVIILEDNQWYLPSDSY